MKVKVLTVATRQEPGLDNLVKSLNHFDIPYDIIGMGKQWKGFGTKVILLREYLKSCDLDYFIFVDAYDVMFVSGLDYILDQYQTQYTGRHGFILFSAEKNCWPNHELKEKYDVYGTSWNFLNSGSFMAPVNDFLELTDKYPIYWREDDQAYYTNILLESRKIELDYECHIFQSIAFQNADDFHYSNLLRNNETSTHPAIIHGNGKTNMDIINQIPYMNTIKQVKEIWKNDSAVHQIINEAFIAKVNAFKELKEHRDFVENHIFGFGERSFLWMWWLIVKEMPEEFTFMEIGVFKGAILSLIRMIASLQGKRVTRYGVTPLDSSGGVWESDYPRDIQYIHDHFGIENDYTIIVGNSTRPDVIDKAKDLALDILYIDGGHTYDEAKSDILNYGPLVKSGGYMVIDDACNDLTMPFGYFQGIQEVTDAVNDNVGEEYSFEFSVVHNKVFKKK